MPINARRLDANYSNFNHAGRDIVTIINVPTADIQQVLRYLDEPPPSGSRLQPRYPVDPLPFFVSSAESHPSHQDVEDVPSVPSLPLAIRFISDITSLLAECSDNHSDLMLELSLLRQMLILTQCTLACYTNTPLAGPLARTVSAEVDRCHSLLQGVLDSLNRYRHIFSRLIGFLWRFIWWARWDAHELTVLRMKLAASRISLYKFLEAMHSASWMNLADKLRTRFLSIKEIHAHLCPPSLRFIQDHTIQVVDQLGSVIPIPTLFCSSPQTFHFILSGYSRNRLGERFIQGGHYQLIRERDGRVIIHSDFPSIIEPNQRLEISIVVRERMTSEVDFPTCPRCRHIFQTSSIGAWIECPKCSGKYRFAAECVADTECSPDRKQPCEDIPVEHCRETLGQSSKRRRASAARTHFTSTPSPFAGDTPASTGPQVLSDIEMHRFHRITVVPFDAVSHPPANPRLSVTPWPATDFKVLIPYIGRCVQKVQHTSSSTVMACKTITWHRQSRRSEVIRTWQDISAIDHVNIVRCYGIHTLPDVNKANILLEFCEGGSLDVIRERMSKLGRPIEEAILGRLAECILQGLVYLHNKKIVRRDIAPPNILLTAAGVVKLCGFGDNVFISTRGFDRDLYLAPERVSSFATHTTRSDMWSVGIILFELAQNRHPIPCRKSLFEMFLFISKGESFTLDDRWSDAMKQWFKRILAFNADERPLPETMLSHPWMLGVRQERVDMALWLQRIWDWRRPWPKTHDVAGGSLHPVEISRPRVTKADVPGNGMRHTKLNSSRIVQRFLLERKARGIAQAKQRLRVGDQNPNAVEELVE